MSLQLRPYQRKIVASVGWSNAIIKMPTGSGKTFVAAEVIRKQLDRGLGRACLFLVPTQDLVDQQSRAIEEWCAGSTVLRFTGGMADPRKWQRDERVCLVSTPQAFRSLQCRQSETFGWQAFGMVVFDEVHHVLKEHPYRHLALSIKDFVGRHKIQVLGLSASLTYQIRDTSITNDLSRLKHELNLEKMESPSLQDLIAGGYNPHHGRNVELESTTEAPEGVIPLAERKPHEMHKQFMSRIMNKEATPFALLVWTVIQKLEDRAKTAYNAFESPLTKPKLVRWEEYAFKLANERPQIERALLKNLEMWYGALRLLVQSWEEEELLVLQWLEMNSAFEFTGSSTIPEVEVLRIRADNPDNFFKFNRLRHHLCEKREQKGNSFRCIVFVQQRITAVILSHFINNDSQLGLSTLGIRAGFVTARESVITPRIKVSKSQAAETIQAFRDHRINVLVATSVIEEGFDVPAANVVISYNHLKDSVELCQRFGRARQQNSAIVLLEERPDRPLSLLESVRGKQDTMIREFDPSAVTVDEEAEKSKQRDRERTAFRSVFMRSGQSAVADIKLFTMKTKASLTEEYENVGGKFKCIFKYRSILRTVVAEAEAPSKKAAKQDSAGLLRITLKAETRS